MTSLVQRMEAKLDRLAAGGGGGGGGGGRPAAQEPSVGAGALSLGASSGGDSDTRRLARKQLGSEGGGDSLSSEDGGGSDRRLLRELDRKVDHISEVVCAQGEEVRSGDDEEDRRRLKEKLKSALDKDRLVKTQKNLSGQEKWLESVFGICEPDARFGKRGSR